MAHSIIVSEKSHSLPPATRKSSGIIWSEAKGLRSRVSLAKVPEFKGSRSKIYNVQEQKQIDEQAQEIKRKNSPFLHPFVSFKCSKNWVMPIHIGESRSVVSDSL